MYKLQRGFTSIQIAFLIFAGIIITGSVVGGALYFSKPELESKVGICGDGICGPIEKDKNICPQDCKDQQSNQSNQQSTNVQSGNQQSTSTQTGNQQSASTKTGTQQNTSTKTGSQQSTSTKTGGNPLRVFFVMHVEPGASGEGEEKQLSQGTYNRLKNATLKVADVLEKHGMRGNFEIVYRISTDALHYEGQDNFITQLKDRGHVIGLHSHHWMLMQSESSCQSLCSSNCQSISSSQKSQNACFVAEGGVEDGLQALKNIGFQNISLMAFRSFAKTESDSKSYEFSRAANLGAKMINDNYNPEDAVSFWAKGCSSFGHGDNNWYGETGNFLHPWRPDYLNGNLCNNNKSGKIVYIDQVSGDWLKSAFGGGHKTLTDTSFDYLRDKFDGALKHVSSEQINVWGWPQHEIEYLSQNSKDVFTGEYSQSALDALDKFLSEIDEYKTSGQVEYATLEDIYNEYVKWESSN